MSNIDEERPPIDWVQDPHTLRLAKRYDEVRRDAHERLLASCERSSDPEVRGEYEAYVAAKKFFAHLRGGKIGSKDDDE